MAKPEWGNKLACRNCGAKFYDLQRDPPVCPRCGTAYKPKRPGRAERPTLEKARPVPVPAAVSEREQEGETEAQADEEEEEELIEDTDDLEGANGVTGVVESMGEDEEER